MPQTHLERNGGSAGSTPPPAPRWVKVFGIIFIVLLLLIGIVLLTGDHGPGRHAPSGEAGGAPAPAGANAERTPSSGGLGVHTPATGPGGQQP
jgi:hypothetical protein